MSDLDFARRQEAWQHVFHGAGTPEDGKIVIAHLVQLTGYYNVPLFDKWVEQYHSTLGFEDHCARHAAKREVFAAILTHLNMSPEALAIGGLR